MDRRVCTTQAEVNAAAAAGDLIVIDSTWRDSSRAVLRGSARAELWGSARAELWDSASAVLWGSSSAELWDESSAVLWDSSRAVLLDSSRAVLWGSASARLWGSSSAVLWGSASARMIGPDVTVTGRTDRAHRVDTAALPPETPLPEGCEVGGAAGVDGRSGRGVAKPEPRTERVPWWEVVGRKVEPGHEVVELGCDRQGPWVRVEMRGTKLYSLVAPDGTVEVLVEDES